MRTLRSISLILLVFAALATLCTANSAWAACDLTGLDPDAEVAELETAVGSICVELLRDDAPLHVDNFLYYLNNGLLVDTFFHRLIPGFVLQGGGFVVGAADYSVVSADNGPVTNEACTLDTPAPPPATAGTMICSVRGNERGTIALAKLGGAPNSGTTNWFINLGDNRTNLDNQNGGFTVFGRIIDMAAVDAIEALTISSDDDVAWLESAVFPSGIGLGASGLSAPLVQPPLYATSYGCFDPSDQASVLDASQLPSLIGVFDPQIANIFFTVSADCGTPTTVATFVEDAGPPECPDLDRIAVRTTGPDSVAFPSGSPEYFELSCEQAAESLLQRNAWQQGFVDHFNDQLVEIEVATVPEPNLWLAFPFGAAVLQALARSRRR